MSSSITTPTTPLELWAGVECTVNRVHARWFDQVERTGHAAREDDIPRLAAMAPKAVRYPVLWERTAPGPLRDADWSFADVRLRQLRALGIRPIVGLVHHGSGPEHTSLLDDSFPEKLASYARAVAQRFPWVVEWTPINEPLTTARFSGLYGLWYPHRRDSSAFARALFVQCRGIALAMRAIREVIPGARLIQTDDMGTVFSTPRLAYQADFENQRRWLGFDLLTGKVNRSHPLWLYLTQAGLSPGELEGLSSEPCPPDVVGINYYVTSDRFLDERVERYPACMHGRNEREVYADVEAVRVRAAGIAAHAGHLEDTWQRYKLPVALTEVHLGCSREEQLRWLAASWNGAMAAQARGVDVRAVTVWSAFGAVDWDSLLTRDQGNVEPGAFDVRGAVPRATAIVAFARELSERGTATHPVVATPGWWQRERRLLYPPFGPAGPPQSNASVDPRPILITGAEGALGRAFGLVCNQRGLAHCLLGRGELDIADPAGVERVFRRLRPWAVINTAGYAHVDAEDADIGRCQRDTIWGAAALAAACGAENISLVTFSSDLVFDGAAGRPYVESDHPRPLGAYGLSMARAEGLVLGALSTALVIRCGPLFGPSQTQGFAARAIAGLSEGAIVEAADDVTISPTYIPDLVGAALDLLIDGEHGVWHLTNREALTWYAFAKGLASACKTGHSTLRRLPAAALDWRAARPLTSALASERGTFMPSLADALSRYASELENAARAAVGAA